MTKLSTGMLISSLCCMSLFFISSCRKAIDLRASLENGDAELGKCAIIGMTLPEEDVFPAPTLTFAYNSHGNPVSVTASPNQQYAQWLFSYDKKDRLSQYSILNADGSFQRWHIYFYDATNRITGDSNYTLGLAGQRATAQFRWFDQLFYDHQNRIVKVIETTPSQFFITEYTYNAEGNLASTLINFNGLDSLKTNSPPFVNHISVLLTNKIWRFLAMDYSVNSHSNADSYNAYGLPTVFSGENGGDIATFFFNGFDNLGLDIQYDCGSKSEAGE